MIKKGLCFLSIFLVTIILGITGVKAAPPQVNATTAVVIDGETGQVLFDQHMHVKRPPASTTKILTTILAIEEGNLKDKVKVSKRAAYQEGSSIYLKPGETIILEDLLYGMMLASGNDAAVAVAEHIGGSVDEFARMMNKKADQIGAKNSNFTNPSGLPDRDHYSTAYDMARIMRYALHNKVFARVTKTKTKQIGNDWGRWIRNHNKLLWMYDDITGGKTGYTRAAGRCLVASARKDGREVIAVVLNCPNDWLEIRKLLDYGLDEFKNVNVIEKGDIVHTLDWQNSLEEKVDMLANKTIKITIPRGEKIKLKKEIYLKPGLQLPLHKGDTIGSLLIYKGDRLLGRTDLLANNDLNYKSLFLRFWHWLVSKFSGK